MAATGGLDGKVVVVTAAEAAAGVADELAAAGAAVVVAGPDAAGVGSALAELRRGGARVAGFIGHVGDPALAEMVAELFPGFEVVTPGGGNDG
jgi:hypothetical protein